MKQFSKDLGNVSLAPKGRWSKEQEYERLNLVYNDCDNLSYVAKIDVPIGVEIDNREYWQPMNATGYADNNFINLTTESETGTVTAYESLEEALATILPINRRAGATLSFYNLNADRLDRQAEFELWQFNSTDLANWENRDYWNNIYYNWNVFAGWYVGADGLKNHVKIPNVGQYAYVGTNLNDALLYQCRTNGTWTNTGTKVRNYISVVVGGNITIGENGNWFSNGKDTGIPATPAVDEQLDNIIMQLQQHTTEINNLKASDANLQDQITSNDSDITNLNAKHESLSRTVQDIAATGGASTATNVTYNNVNSGLNAENAQDAIDELQSSKFDKTSILQESGEAEDKVMSQKVVSDKFSELEESFNDIIIGDLSSIDMPNDGYVNIGGSISGIGSTHKHSNPLRVSAGDTVTVRCFGTRDNVVIIASYSQNGEFIEVLQVSTANKVKTYEITIQEDTYIVVSADLAYEFSASIKRSVNNVDILYKEVSINSDKIDKLENIIVRNNKTDVSFANDGYIRADGSINSAYLTYGYTNPIQVFAGDTIEAFLQGTSNNVSVIAKCDKNMINITPVVVADSNSFKKYIYTIEDDGYIILTSFRGTDKYRYTILSDVNNLDKTNKRIDKIEDQIESDGYIQLEVGTRKRFTTLRACLEYIGYNQDKLNFEIRVYNDINIMTEYSEDELSTPMITGMAWLGLYIPRRTKLVGVGNPTISMEWMNDSLFSNDRSMLNVFNDFCASNITFIANNVRYILHQDCETAQDKVSECKNCTFIMKKHTLSGYSGSIAGMGVDNGCVVKYDSCEFVDYNTQSRTHTCVYGHLDADTTPCKVIAENCSFSGGFASFGFSGGNDGSIKNYVIINNCSLTSPIMIGGKTSMPTSVYYRGTDNKGVYLIPNPKLVDVNSVPVDWTKYCEINAVMGISKDSVALQVGNILCKDGSMVRRMQSVDNPSMFFGFALESFSDRGIVQTSGNIPLSVIGLTATVGDNVYIENGALNITSGYKIGAVRTDGYLSIFVN